MDINDFLNNELLAEASSTGHWYLWYEERTDCLLFSPDNESGELNVGLPLWDKQAPRGTHRDDSLWVLDRDTEVVTTEGGFWFLKTIGFENLNKEAVSDCGSFLRAERSRVLAAANRELEIRENELMKVVSWLKGCYAEGQSYDDSQEADDSKRLDDISLSMIDAILQLLSQPEWREDTMNHNRNEDFDTPSVD